MTAHHQGLRNLVESAYTKRQAAQKLRALRAEWKAWKTADVNYLSHFDLCIGPCAAGCGQCEGCGMALYRRDRMAEIEAEAHRIKQGVPA